MPGFHEQINNWIVPAALGAALYFLQAMAHDNQELTRTVAVVIRRLDEYERRIANLEETRTVWPRRQSR